MLCKNCVGSCKRDGAIAIECPNCKGFGCESCNEGDFTVECPREFCAGMVQEINIASCASKGFLPAAGGVLDQTNWFIELWSMLDNEHAAIDREKLT